MTGCWGWDGMGWSGGGSWGLVSGFLLLLFLIAVVIVVVLVVRVLLDRESRGRAELHTTPPSAGGSDAHPALRILEERYARGEIDRQEFLERKEGL